ncbi:hypothetical protein LC613_11880 [Nostoc sphaeroides CHAB 2801]|uniref:hypothetical protein n=1 Tax=Nostoc sphaeroides TaxID=446679 RepID=UPI0015F311F4|nr:hypothetical protein [Nostoc sphaeroides]MCC5628755.1 hypothetical protein [Nostoc sphaeroides CHAB 2801]
MSTHTTNKTVSDLLLISNDDLSCLSNPKSHLVKITQRDLELFPGSSPQSSENNLSKPD